MHNFRLSLLGLCAAPLLTIASAALAQEAVVGDPALSNFQLKPRDSKPAPEPGPTVAPLKPAATATNPGQSAEPVVIAPPPPTRQTVTETAPARARPDRAAPVTRSAPTEAAPIDIGTIAPSAGDAAPALALPPPETEAPALSIPLPGDATTPAPVPAIPYWAYALAAAMTGLLAYAGLRRARAVRQYVSAPAQRAAHPVARAPTRPAHRPPAPTPAPPPIAKAEPRPRLELEFKPARASANAAEASVQFELLVRNVGDVAANNVRIDAAIFNAGAEKDGEIAAFFAQPVRPNGEATIGTIPPGRGGGIRGVLAMAKNVIREIRVQNRVLFVPVVAFNVVYEWGNGQSGQTSTSHVVGLEPSNPSAKMGPFRLDQGPRIYRSVGQRRTQLERVL